VRLLKEVTRCGLWQWKKIAEDSEVSSPPFDFTVPARIMGTEWVIALTPKVAEKRFSVLLNAASCLALVPDRIIPGHESDSFYLSKRKATQSSMFRNSAPIVPASAPVAATVTAVPRAASSPKPSSTVSAPVSTVNSVAKITTSSSSFSSATSSSSASSSSTPAITAPCATSSVVTLSTPFSPSAKRPLDATSAEAVSIDGASGASTEGSAKRTKKHPLQSLLSLDSDKTGTHTPDPVRKSTPATDRTLPVEAVDISHQSPARKQYKRSISVSSDFISPPDNSHIGFLKRNGSDVSAAQLSMVLSPDAGSRSSARVRGVVLHEAEVVKGKETAKEKAAEKKREKEEKEKAAEKKREKEEKEREEKKVEREKKEDKKKGGKAQGAEEIAAVEDEEDEEVQFIEMKDARGSVSSSSKSKEKRKAVECVDLTKRSPRRIMLTGDDHLPQKSPGSVSLNGVRKSPMRESSAEGKSTGTANGTSSSSSSSKENENVKEKEKDKGKEKAKEKSSVAVKPGRKAKAPPAKTASAAPSSNGNIKSFFTKK
jgi:hypothetical protein